MKLRLSEIYCSVQGEGPRVGTPTIFVRLAGCNLRCPGWPCDTQHAIDPSKYRQEWLSFSADDLVKLVRSHAHYDTIHNICITGGEPFLQPEEELRKLTYALWCDGKSIEFFSNGTFVYPHWVFNPGVSVVMDWKLPGSGEAENIDYGAIITNVFKFSRYHGCAVKFTVANRLDFDAALETCKVHLAVPGPIEIYCGPVWGKLEAKELVAWMLEVDVPWKLNLQTHKYIFDPEARGI